MTGGSGGASSSKFRAQSQVIPGEDPADLETLTAEYREEYHPTTPKQRDLVDSLIYAT